jgi:UDP-N-acetylmuramoyl-tripeptide--D-alanyl-D-alanine ligase
LFFALKGEKFDGNLFVNEALEKGARWAVADKNTCTPGDKIILVDNVLSVLQQLANFHRKQLNIKILAVTGSNGKTTTKELCAKVLGVKYKTYATQGNLNNHIGVPLTLLAMKPGTEMGIVEMGANHPGEIKALCEIAEPDYGLITNIGKAHLEGFKSIKGVSMAKGELFHFLEKNNGYFFANMGNKYIRLLFANNKDSSMIIKYNHKDAIWAELIDSALFLEMLIHDYDEVFPLKTSLVGKYNYENVLAAYAVGKYFEISPKEIIHAIENFLPSNSRSQFIKTGRNEIIMDAYNANPSSMRAAIENFLQINRQPKFVILGEMLELGDSSTDEHRKIIDMLAAGKAQNVICIGSNFHFCSESAGYRWFPDVTSLNMSLQGNPIKNHLILIKGSRGNQLEKALEFL